MARQTLTAEFRAEVVRLVREGKRGVTAVARDLGVGQQTLSRWLRQGEIDEGCGPEGALTTAEREELQRLRRENKRLQEERDILERATAFLVRANR